MRKPFLLNEGATVDADFYFFVEVIASCMKVGCLDELLEASKKAGCTVSVPASSVNFVKEFMFERRLDKKHPAALAILRSATCGKKPGWSDGDYDNPTGEAEA